MSDDNSDSIQYKSSDIEKSQKERSVNFFKNTDERKKLTDFFKGKKKIAIILAAAILVLAGMVTAIILIVRISGDGDVTQISPTEQYEALEQNYSNYLFNDGSAEEIEVELKSFIENNSEHTDLVVKAKRLLSNFYENNGNFWQAIDLITSSLNDENLSGSDQATLLSIAADLYEKTGQTTEEVRTIERLLQLPDDIVLEGESLENVKIFYKNKLEQLMQNGE